MVFKLNPTTGRLDEVEDPGSGTATTSFNTDSGIATPDASGQITFTGSPSGMTFSGASNTVTLGGVLNLSHGGTNANLTADNGGIFYSTATAAAILAHTTTANQLLLSGSSAAPSWSTATYPATTTINQVLYSSANNTVTGLTTANNGTFVTSAAGVPSVLAGPGATGRVLQSNAAAAPSWSTATFPGTAGATGTILRSDGTNWVVTTATYPNVATSTGTLLRANGTNWVASTATYPDVATSAGTILRADGTNWVASTATYPNVATSAGTILRADGTNWVASTATYPNTATSTGTILRADGTNWSATTATYPTTTTANRILYSSATNTISEITSAANSLLVTDGSSVPSIGTSVNNDITFGGANSGATRTFTVSNTSNTASSKANIISSVGGATADDATHQAIVTGATTWTWGVDNSDSDAFVIAASATLGTTNVMRVQTTGEINYPLQSSFLATANAQSNVTGDATNYSILFANEIFDQNNDFASSTYTCPVTSRVQLSATISANGLAAGNTSGSWIIQTSNRNYIFSQLNWGATANVGTAVNQTGSVLADMDAADVANVICQVSGGTKVVSISATQTSFSGFIAC